MQYNDDEKDGWTDDEIDRLVGRVLRAPRVRCWRECLFAGILCFALGGVAGWIVPGGGGPDFGQYRCGSVWPRGVPMVTLNLSDLVDRVERANLIAAARP